MMIEMQYEYNNLHANDAGGGFASSTFETNFKKDGTFTKIEPISVLDTRSPSPSTSTSTFPLFNNATQAGFMAANKHTMVASATTGGCGGGGEEGYFIGPQSVYNGDLELCGHWLSDKFNLGVEERENLYESAAACQSEILKLFLQAGNQSVFQCNTGFGAMDTGLESTGFSGSTAVGNDFSSYNTPLLSLSESGFVFNDNKDLFGLDSNCLLSHNNGNTSACLASGTIFEHQHEILEDKAEIFNPQACLNPSLVQNAANLSMTNFHPSIFGTQQEQQHRLQSCQNNPNVGIVKQIFCSQNNSVQFVDSGLLMMKQRQSPQILQTLEDLEKKPLLVPKHETVDGCLGQMSTIPIEQQQVVCDHLYKAAESMMTGNFSIAQGILARLNQLLSPIAEPFLRSAFFVKEVLQSVLVVPNHIAPIPPRIPTPFDGMFKMGAYKLFSDVSPVIQFTNFTANQAFLEALDDAEQIHIIDFDIGFGAHWSSFLQELPGKNGGTTSLKITAFVSPCSYHAIEISLMHENLAHFANDLGIKFELSVVNIDSFDPNSGSLSLFRSSESETIAVNFPIWSFTSCLSSLPSYICFIKKLSPKVIVSLDRGFERTDLPFSHHILHTLRCYEALLGSVDATNMASDAANKIEKFLFQPKIENTVLGRLFYPNIMPPWRNLFTTAGLLPAPISNFSETQAECVLKKVQARGFHVERRQASLVLCWQQCELISVSAWTC